MIIYNKLSSPSNYYSSYTRPTDNIKWIVMHYTGNDGDTAKGNANYFANNSVSASAHYFVDDISIYRSVPDEYTAWSVGGSQYSDCGKTGGGRYHGQCTNSNSISIEMCDTNKDGRIDVSEATLKNAVDLTRMLMNKYHIDINHVICHFDVTGKRCPNFNDGAWILGQRKDFKRFKAMLEDDDMTEAQVKQIAEEVTKTLLQGVGTTPSAWAEKIHTIDRAKEAGITKEGERPRGYATREETMEMCLGVLEDLKDGIKAAVADALSEIIKDLVKTMGDDAK